VFNGFCSFNSEKIIYKKIKIKKMKKIFKHRRLAFILSIVVIIAGYNMSINTQNEEVSSIYISNAKAIAGENETGSWIRNDADCVYTFSGNPYGQITVFGNTLTFNGFGIARYTITGGKTHCSNGGNELCTARYCPTQF
jgi:hypothetical protein